MKVSGTDSLNILASRSLCCGYCVLFIQLETVNFVKVVGYDSDDEADVS